MIRRVVRPFLVSIDLSSHRNRGLPPQATEALSHRSSRQLEAITERQPFRREHRLRTRVLQICCGRSAQSLLEVAAGMARRTLSGDAPGALGTCF